MQPRVVNSNSKKKNPKKPQPVIKRLMQKEEQAINKVERNYHANELASIGILQKPKVQRSTKGMRRLNVPGPPLPPHSNYPKPLMFATSGVATADNSHLQARNGSSVLVNLGMGGKQIISTGKPQLDAMFSGLASYEARMPDPYTAVKTFVTDCFYNSVFVPAFPSSGTTTYGGFCFAFNGSPLKTVKFPTVTPGSSTVAIAWNGGSYVDAGINNANFVSRPMGVNASMTFELIGPVHNVIVNALPLLPCALSGLAAAPGGFPTAQEEGLTTLQSVMGGRSWSVSPGSTVSLACVPLDNRSWDFEASNTERGHYDALGQLSWGGWVVWGWGLTAGDKILFRTTYGEECAIVPGNSTIYNYAQEKNPCDPVYASKIKDMFSTLVDEGFSAIEYAASAALPIMYAAIRGHSMGPLDSVLAKNGVSLGSAQPSYDRGANLVRATREPKPPFSSASEHKVPDIEDLPLTHLSEATKTVNALTDAPEMVTPKNARRPSLSLSLTSRKK